MRIRYDHPDSVVDPLSLIVKGVPERRDLNWGDRMKGGAIVCFVLSGLTMLLAVKNIIARVATQPDRVEYLGGYVVGSLLIPVVLLIVGISMWQKANRGSGSGR
jgi:hypothetical protein